jgi:hypothetical protein
MCMRINKTRRNDMVMKLKSVDWFDKGMQLFFVSITSMISILINNNRMIFECCILGSHGTNPFGRNNRADKLDTSICHELLFEGVFKDDRFITLRAGRYNMNRHFA